MVADTSDRLGFEEVAGGGLEELHDGVVLERRRVGDVDDDGGTFERVRQAFAREGVDTRGRRGGQHLDALISERGHDFRADAPAAADHDDLHDVLLLLEVDG